MPEILAAHNIHSKFLSHEDIEKLLCSEVPKEREIGAVLKEMTAIQFEVSRAELLQAGDALAAREVQYLHELDDEPGHEESGSSSPSLCQY